MPTADDLARIALQEKTLQFSAFDEESAWKLGFVCGSWRLRAS